MPQIDPVLARRIASTIAGEIGAQPAQAQAAIGLLDEGATVPFIARYRKEVTGGLDDIQLRELEARLSYLRELDDRRAAVLKSIDEQGKLTDALRAAIAAAPTKQELEDIYLPFKQKRRTKGQMAREFGIEPLDPEHDRAMICGSPQMLADFRALLDGRGFTAAPRIGTPGQYVFERAFVEK